MLNLRRTPTRKMYLYWEGDALLATARLRILNIFLDICFSLELTFTIAKVTVSCGLYSLQPDVAY
jgi:hypothetical protein